MNGRRMAGAIVGSLIAGVGISVLLMAGERKSGKASELVELERTGAHRLGVHAPGNGRLPDATEQAVVQAGHLALSVAAGAVYAAATDEETGVFVSGIGFGLAFYAAMHWITGPLLGVKKPEWRAGAGTIGVHALNHVLFGLATAAGAKALGVRR